MTTTSAGVLRITWIGHSTVLIELDGVRLLTDPVLRGRLYHLRRVSGPARADALGDVDALLVSHVHHDHLDPPSLAGFDRAVRVIVPKGAASVLRRRGFSRVTELEEGEETSLASVSVRATHAEHDARRIFGSESPTLGYVVAGTLSLFFAGDTDLFYGMEGIASNLDVALLPVAGWGPRLPKGHLDPSRAAQAVALLRPRVAVPIHWGTYRRIGLARDPELLRAPADAFARHVAELAPDVEVRVLEVGGSLELAPARDGSTDGVVRPIRARP